MPDSPTEAPHTGGAFNLFRWFWPYLAPARRRLLLVLVASVVILVCEALIPLTVDHLIAGETLEGALVVGLIVMALVQSALVWWRGSRAGRVCNQSGTRLRARLIERTQLTEVLFQRGMVRPSVVSRNSTDVDNVVRGVGETLIEGVPSVGRIVLGLVLLTWILPPAGFVMIGATVLFLLLRALNSRRQLEADRRHLETLSEHSAAVDETVSGARAVTGLRLEAWRVAVTIKLARALEVLANRQDHRLAELRTGSVATGLLGLVVVVIVALARGGNYLATVAAAILYVNAVVSGLAVLPMWLRIVNLGSVSALRIDQILLLPDRLAREDASPMGHERGLWVEHVDADLDGILINGADLNLGEGVIGLVTTPGVDPDEILALLAGERQFETGTVRLDGQPTSSLAQRGLVRHVPVEGVGFQASPQELFQAVAPGLDLGDVKDLLVDVGLAELAEQDSFLEGSMGHVGDALTTAQRQRLALAVGLAAEPAALLVGPIYPVVEPDAILSLLESIARRLPRCAVITVRTPEVADLVDRVLFADGTTLLVGHHHDLLIGNERYAALWQSHVDRLLPAIDLSVLGIDDDAADSLRLRLITERCDAGEMLYRQGDEADRLLFIVSGRVEIQVAGADGSPRVVAVLGPGDHCGDLTLMPGERRVETAVAREACVLRSLSRHAIEAGHLGILDRTPIERRVLVSLLREGAADEATLTTRLNIEEGAVVAALALLRRDNAVTIAAGKFSAVLGTTRSRLSGDLAEKLGF